MHMGQAAWPRAPGAEYFAIAPDRVVMLLVRRVIMLRCRPPASTHEFQRGAKNKDVGHYAMQEAGCAKDCMATEAPGCPVFQRYSSRRMWSTRTSAHCVGRNWLLARVRCAFCAERREE